MAASYSCHDCGVVLFGGERPGFHTEHTGAQSTRGNPVQPQYPVLVVLHYLTAGCCTAGFTALCVFTVTRGVVCDHNLCTSTKQFVPQAPRNTHS